MDIPDLESDVEKGETVAAQPERLAIPCPRCQQILHCPPELVGTKGQCRGCKHIFVISTAPVAAQAEEAWVFNCPSCDQLFDGNEEMRGRKGKCHACGEVFAIELKRPTPEPESDGVVEANSATPPPIQLACGACEGVMEVPADSAGCTAECPFCQALLEIPG
ncbi:MAG: hypothetical protein Aurels2KO_20460 [Aureliella sp.]